MLQQSAPATRPGLEEVKRQFEHWRETRHTRSPIPNHLWASAVSLAQDYSICKIAKVLHLNHSHLKKRVLAVQAQESLQPGPSFVEFELTSSLPCTEYHLETEARDGSKLKMQLKGPDLPNPLEILSAFWSKGT
ncbi:hypothetical protein Dthio_PD3707 [Desulfonatronospira thiodismutans ASO3-1]|uniref:Uncharacterized protein n=1 Tax=Desulfonatronospira thiodismutans ASO3-1 TaxID=555779 RepID=D6SK47_9BACT|nr:hypothetical protein [Desulfonatronospira thiodismutans]EFI36250.1 hypothetical protein Dthio_PD3707 [Desulfonatronospira thiodismutans ASO3-1]